MFSNMGFGKPAKCKEQLKEVNQCQQQYKKPGLSVAVQFKNTFFSFSFSTKWKICAIENKDLYDITDCGHMLQGSPM